MLVILRSDILVIVINACLELEMHLTLTPAATKTNISRNKKLPREHVFTEMGPATSL